MYFWRLMSIEKYDIVPNQRNRYIPLATSISKTGKFQLTPLVYQFFFLSHARLLLFQYILFYSIFKSTNILLKETIKECVFCWKNLFVLFFYCIFQFIKILLLSAKRNFQFNILLLNIIRFSMVGLFFISFEENNF